jgi:hypothetical protein
VYSFFPFTPYRCWKRTCQRSPNICSCTSFVTA